MFKQFITKFYSRWNKKILRKFYSTSSSFLPKYSSLFLTFPFLFFTFHNSSLLEESPTSSPQSKNSSVKLLSKDQLKSILEKKINSLKSMSTRNIQVNIRFSGKPGEECHIVELTNIHSSSILDMISIVSEILLPGVIELHSIGNDGHGGKVLSFVSSTGDRSLSIAGSELCVLSIFKDDGFSLTDVEAITKAYKVASSLNAQERSMMRPPLRHPSDLEHGTKKKSKEEAVTKLQTMGINIYAAIDPSTSDQPPLSWESLAGYQHVKKEIKNTILTPLLHPEVYDNITKYTRESFESNRPKAVLLEGPPGTGKTLTAKIIAQESSKPMVHLPLEVISSKWYGESEKRIAEIFDCCDALGGAVIFIDEIDSLVGSRDNIQMHEASRRILSVILQRIEGFTTSSSDNQNILICATNRKTDLDAALLSRFDVIIQYSLPDYDTRKAVFKKYAKQLGRLPLNTLAELSEGMSNRDIKEVCEHAERSWASKMIEQADITGIKQGLPTSSDYLESLEIRKKSKENSREAAESMR